MPGYLTDGSNNRVLDCLFGGQPLTPPVTLYVGLSLARANKQGTVAEPVAPGYARVAVPNDPAHFPKSIVGTKANGSKITFPSPVVNWGSIASVFVADSPQGGNVLAIADLPSPRPILAMDPAPSIAVGALYLSHN